VADGADLDEPDDLYALEPAAFIAARDALAKRLRADGRREEAAVVAKLRKPSAPAWALNQVARSDPSLVEAALDAGARLREATDAAVGGDPATLRQATAEDRKASDAVVDAAADRLGGRGPAARQQLAATLRAAVLDDGVADELRRGVLAVDHDAAGFGFGFGFDDGGGDEPAPPRPAKQAKAAKPAPKKQAAGRDQAKDEAKAEEQRRRDEEQAAEELARAERKRRAELETEATRLEKRAARLAREADRAEEDARQARTEADAAAEEADAARRAADAAGDPGDDS
jgi:hypothetical protein